MKDLSLHIISFNVPLPADYGGVIDVFYKVKALHQLGVKITLHCFSYGREPVLELEKYTEKTYYYKRQTTLIKQFSSKPYIVNSRSHALLLKRLLADDNAILFEGLHSCYYLSHPQLQGRVKMVRTHNIEHDYYIGLANQESHWGKRLFFNIEASKLRRYESVLKHSTAIAAISQSDLSYFNEKYGGAFLLSPFHSNEEVCISQEGEKYLLYHGSLDVAENIEAVLFLIDAFRFESDLSVVIAGSHVHSSIRHAIVGLSHFKIVESPSYTELKSLISKAQINILPTFQPTGVKLKLLEALFSGKLLICNEAMVHGTGLSSVCQLAESQQDFVDLSRKLIDVSFTEQDIAHRKEVLNENFNNLNNAQIIVNQILKA